MRALVSVHDVMPETLERVQRILDLCARVNPGGPLTLLVIPGRDWDQAGIDRLGAWQAAGHRLAGHGWLHRVERFGGLSHRLHGALISRRVAEHLALDGPAIAGLIQRCHAWFRARGLTPPDLYVPPAWSMGAIRPADLAALPFDRYEVLTGVRDAATGRLLPVPMLGFEADTPARVPAIRLWNRINRRRAETRGWLRLAIHPDDLDLRLAADLREELSRYSQWDHYAALAQQTA
jgi:predicted deacetylase